MRERRRDKSYEERMRRRGSRLELGVELARDEIGMVREFDDLHQGTVGRDAAYAEPRRLQRPARLPIVGQLVAVAVALRNAQ